VSTTLLIKKLLGAQLLCLRVYYDVRRSVKRSRRGWSGDVLELYRVYSIMYERRTIPVQSGGSVWFRARRGSGRVKARHRGAARRASACADAVLRPRRRTRGRRPGRRGVQPPAIGQPATIRRTKPVQDVSMTRRGILGLFTRI